MLIYTCIVGNYDDLLAPLFTSENIEYVYLSDRQVPVPSPWKLQILPPMPGSAPELNRFAKMHPHVLFPEHKASVYVDGNIRVVGDPTALVAAALSGSDLALFQHPVRDCAYEEAQECAIIGHDWLWRIQRQMARYRDDGFPSHHGLFEAGVIVRRHAAPDVQALMTAWWAEYLHGIRRDQLSLPYLAWKHAVSIRNLGASDARFKRSIFSLGSPHRPGLASAILFRGRVNRLVQRFFGPLGS